MVRVSSEFPYKYFENRKKVHIFARNSEIKDIYG